MDASSLVSFVDAQVVGEEDLLRRHCLLLHCGGRERMAESVLHLILPMLDDATKVAASELWSEQMLAANEASLLRACKLLVLGQERPQQQQRIQSLASKFATWEGIASQSQSQWRQLMTVIADRVQQQEAEAAARHREALDSLGALLLLSPTFVHGGKNRMIQDSVLRACLEAEPELVELVESLFGPVSTDTIAPSVEVVAGNKRKSASSSSSVHDFVDCAFRFCYRSSGVDDDVDWLRCSALGRVLRRVAAEDVASARAVVYRLGSELSLLAERQGEGQDSSQLYAFATFLATAASSMMLSGAVGTDAPGTPQAPPSSKRSKAAGWVCAEAEGDVLRSELQELLGWAVGRLWCALSNLSTPEAVPRNLPRALALLTVAIEGPGQAEGASARLPMGLLDCVNFLRRNASGAQPACDIALSSELHLFAASRLYPGFAGGMARIAALGRPRLIHACHSILGATAALFQEASGSHCDDETRSFRLLLLVQTLKPLYIPYPALLCRVVAEAAALALRPAGRKIDAEEEERVLMTLLSFFSNLSCFGETRVHLDCLLDACTPAPAADADERGPILQAALFIMACRPGSGDEPGAASWLRDELTHRPHGAMTLLRTCADLIGRRADRAGLAEADVVQGVRQAVAAALAGLPTEGAGSYGESLRAALACFCEHIGPFFQTRAATTSASTKSATNRSTSSSGTNDVGPQPSDVLWQTVEAQQLQVQQQWPADGEAALMSLFSAVSTARGLTLTMPLPALPWVLAQTINRVACEAFCDRDESLCRAARRFVGQTSVLAALLQAHGSHEYAPPRAAGGQAHPTPSTVVPLLLCPMETFLFPVLPPASALARPSPLQLDLLLSTGPARRGGAPPSLHRSSLACEDWASLTFATIHAVRGGVRERELLEEPGVRGEAVVESALLAVVRAHAARIVLPALGHALQWHLLRLAKPPQSSQPAELGDSLAYCVACAEVAAACLSPRSLGLLLASVLDGPTLGMCYRCLVLARGTDRSAGEQRLQWAVVHLMSVLERGCCGHGRPGLDSEPLPLQMGVLSLLSLGYWALGLDSAAAGVRARLLGGLARLAPLLAAAVVCAAEKGQGKRQEQRQKQSVIGFLVSCGGCVYSLTHFPDNGSVVVSGPSDGEENDGGAFLCDVMLLGAPEGLRQAVLLPRLESVWAALLGASEPLVVPCPEGRYMERSSARLVAELERDCGSATVSTAAWTSADVSPHPAVAATTHPALGCLLTCVIAPWQQRLGEADASRYEAWSALLHRLMAHRCAAASHAEEPRTAATLADLALSFACSQASGEVLLAALQAAAQARAPTHVAVALKLLLCLPRGLAWAQGGPLEGAVDRARRGVGDLSSLLAAWAGPEQGTGSSEVARACPWAWGLLTDLLCETAWLVVSAEKASALPSVGPRGEAGEGGGEGGGEGSEDDARRCLGLLQSQGSDFVSGLQRCVQALSGAQREAGAFESRVRAACCGWRCGPAPEAWRERRSLGAAIVLQTRALAPAMGSAAVHIPTSSSASFRTTTSTTTSSQGAIGTPPSCSPVKAATPQSPRSPGARGLGLAALLHARCRPQAPAHMHADANPAALDPGSGYGVGGEAIREFIAAYYPDELQAGGGRGPQGGDLGVALAAVRAVPAAAAAVTAESCPPPAPAPGPGPFPAPLSQEDPKPAGKGKGRGRGRGRGKEAEAPEALPGLPSPPPPPPADEADDAAAAPADTWAAGDIAKKFAAW